MKRSTFNFLLFLVFAGAAFLTCIIVIEGNHPKPPKDSGVLTTINYLKEEIPESKMTIFSPSSAEKHKYLEMECDGGKSRYALSREDMATMTQEEAVHLALVIIDNISSGYGRYNKYPDPCEKLPKTMERFKVKP